MGTTSISVEVGDTTFICVIVIFEVTNSISGKVGTLTLIEYQIRDYQYLSGGSDADLYRMYVCNSSEYQYRNGFRDTDFGDISM